MADISKIRINDIVYDIKDEELRQSIEILLCKRKNKELDIKDDDSYKSN